MCKNGSGQHEMEKRRIEDRLEREEKIRNHVK